MMFFLIIYVNGNSFNLRFTYRNRKIIILPAKFPVN